MLQPNINVNLTSISNIIGTSKTNDSSFLLRTVKYSECTIKVVEIRICNKDFLLRV